MVYMDESHVMREKKGEGERQESYEMIQRAREEGRAVRKSRGKREIAVSPSLSYNLTAFFHRRSRNFSDIISLKRQRSISCASRFSVCPTRASTPLLAFSTNPSDTLLLSFLSQLRFASAIPRYRHSGQSLSPSLSLYSRFFTSFSQHPSLFRTLSPFIPLLILNSIALLAGAYTAAIIIQLSARKTLATFYFLTPFLPLSRQHLNTINFWLVYIWTHPFPTFPCPSNITGPVPKQVRKQPQSTLSANLYRVIVNTSKFFVYSSRYFNPLPQYSRSTLNNNHSWCLRHGQSSD